MQLVKQQRRVAEKALLGLHKRSKAAARGGGGMADEAKGVADASGGAAPSSTDGVVLGGAAVVQSASDVGGANPFLSTPLTEDDCVGAAGSGSRGTSGAILAADSVFQVRDLNPFKLVDLSSKECHRKKMPSLPVSSPGLDGHRRP